MLENAPAFGTKAEALENHFGGAGAVHGDAAQNNGALTGFQQSGNGIQGGGLSGTVGANQGYDFALMHFQADALYRMDGAVIYMQVLDLQQGQILIFDFAHFPPSLFLPR